MLESHYHNNNITGVTPFYLYELVKCLNPANEAADFIYE